MKLKLGDIVLWRDNLSATFIAQRGTNFLIGWKDADPNKGYGWVISQNIGSLRNATTIENISEFYTAFWVVEKDLVIARALHRLGRKTLQKRMRDQIAQEILNPKE